MAVSHVLTSPIADKTGTVTVWDGATTASVAATDLVRPSNWNSAHYQYYTLSGNTTNASTASGTNVVLSAAGKVVLAGSTATIVVSGPNDRASYVQPLHGSVAVGAIMNGSLWVMPVPIGAFQVDRLLHYMSVSQSSSTNSSYQISLSVIAGLYTKNADTLSLASSGSSLYTWSITSNNTTANQAGIRIISAPLSATFDGQAWLAFGVRSSSANANWATFTQLVVSQLNSAFSGHLNSASAASQQMALGYGTYSATTAAMPASIAFSDIRMAGAALWRSAPLVALQSGTV